MSVIDPRPLRLDAATRLARADGLPLLMGVLNVTPDSFSDGGCYLDAEAAAAHACRLAADGADIIDIGAESSRPGAEPLSADDEWRRLEPVFARLNGKLSVPLSVDTYHAGVARRALDAGARFINDISAGNEATTDDPQTSGNGGMIALAAERAAPICLMHMRGRPKDMQRDPMYDNVVGEVRDFLEGRVRRARAAGLPGDSVVVDPGFGFGKTVEHNVALVRALATFRELGVVLIGVSRKSTLAALSGGSDRERLPESVAGAIACAAAGADILRVHDVEATLRALRVWRALR